MQRLQDRRGFLAAISSAGAGGLAGRRRLLAALSSAGVAGLAGAGHSFAQDGPPETTTIRLPKGNLICQAPQYIADELLRAEGFTDIQHVPTSPDALGRGELDLALAYVTGAVAAIDAGAPVTVVAGVHGGCNATFAHEGIRALRDLKGKRVAVNAASPTRNLLAAMLVYIGLDPAKDIEWVPSAFTTGMELFIERKVDAYTALPPALQELRARKIGHVIVDSARDRPWSQLYCCMLAGNREFVRNHPMATKRALRAILKAADFCASDPAGAAGQMVDRGLASSYDYTFQSLSENAYNRWREFDAEDSIRFYALRLREAGIIKSTPGKIIADGTDWRFLNELKRELKA
jgi:NitT/TauT family transport system substrate-binding protein